MFGELRYSYAAVDTFVVLRNISVGLVIGIESVRVVLSFKTVRVVFSIEFQLRTVANSRTGNTAVRAIR